jgi:hypothetical protein
MLYGRKKIRNGRHTEAASGRYGKANPTDLPVLIPLINPAFAIKTFSDGTAGSRKKNIVSGITPAVNNNPTTNTVFSAVLDSWCPPPHSEKFTPTIQSNRDD